MEKWVVSKVLIGKKEHYKHGKSPAILKTIHEPEINLAIWERSRVHRCDEAINYILATEHPHLLDIKPISQKDLYYKLGSLINYNISTEALAKDIWTIFDLFCKITNQCTGRVRLSRVENNACQLFHADTLEMRMLCTYSGLGTEWVENNNARYNELGSKGRSKEETNDSIVIDADKIHVMQPWHVAIFSGRKKKKTLPLIHRSSPVNGKEEYRVRLCIDYPDACGCS